ncbi:probable polyamine oxidase 5 [Salvia miltiorrhiza]|uniref:probable polyamine oxidase 5 n=1 Tax=Salvia miltiorrhiza TaxID=226208 RepID=UPI0025AC260F|nr:probable polyamine oxidase 5 [Salvia miltiorrhiza]
MGSKKPRVVIIGGGMAGLTAAHKLYTSTTSFDLHVVEGGTRIGGRINTSQFCGDRVELGATWIHGIQGSPIYKIAQDTTLLHSHHPWECMDGFPHVPLTAAEGGHHLHPSLLTPISNLFKNLMDFIQGRDCQAASSSSSSAQIIKHCIDRNRNLSVGSFLRSGLDAYWGVSPTEDTRSVGKWRRKPLEAAVFAMHENTQRSFTAADDLHTLDYEAERHYVMFPGEEITIARGYSAVIDSLASVLPAGVVQLGRKVEKIEWRLVGDSSRPVKLHFGDGSTLSADHVIVTVSLGVLKRGIGEDRSMFDPPLPSPKIRAIKRLGFGVVDKVFVQQSSGCELPSLQMAFHAADSELRNPSIPEWMRRTSAIYPIYRGSRVCLAWFTGKEALEVEDLSEEEIINGFSATASDFLSLDFKFGKALRTRWGTNPLFFGSYSYVAVGSTIADMDTLSEPLPEELGGSTPRLQIMFAGEATHAAHYSTTHGAYFSGLREANRLLQHYNINVASL